MYDVAFGGLSFYFFLNDMVSHVYLSYLVHYLCVSSTCDDLDLFPPMVEMFVCESFFEALKIVTLVLPRLTVRCRRSTKTG